MNDTPRTSFGDTVGNLFGAAKDGKGIMGNGSVDPAMQAQEQALLAGEMANGYVPTAGLKSGIAGTSPMEGGGAPNDPYGSAMSTAQDIANTGAQRVQGASLLDGLQNYMSPYTNDVVNTTLAGFDQDAGRTRAQQQLDIAGDTTFGGSGGSILRSLTEGELSRGRASTEAQLRDEGFKTGAGLSATDAGMRQQAGLANASLAEQALQRRLSGATSLADIAGAQQGNERANIATQSQIGEMLRQIEAARRGAPIAALGAESSLINGLPFDLFKGQNATGSLTGTSTTKQSGASLADFLSFFAANASAAASGAGGG